MIITDRMKMELAFAKYLHADYSCDELTEDLVCYGPKVKDLAKRLIQVPELQEYFALNYEMYECALVAQKLTREIEDEEIRTGFFHKLAGIKNTIFSAVSDIVSDSVVKSVDKMTDEPAPIVEPEHKETVREADRTKFVVEANEHSSLGRPATFGDPEAIAKSHTEICRCHSEMTKTELDERLQQALDKNYPLAKYGDKIDYPPIDPKLIRFWKGGHVIAKAPVETDDRLLRGVAYEKHAILKTAGDANLEIVNAVDSFFTPKGNYKFYEVKERWEHDRFDPETITDYLKPMYETKEIPASAFINPDESSISLNGTQYYRRNEDTGEVVYFGPKLGVYQCTGFDGTKCTSKTVTVICDAQPQKIITELSEGSGLRISFYFLHINYALFPELPATAEELNELRSRYCKK